MRRLLFLAAILVAGCQSVPSLGPYRVDVQQGNYVTQAMVSKLQPGMTRAQVRYTLGQPLIVDPFHSDRWDYVYVYNKAGRLTEQRRIVVIFDGDKLVRVEGDVTPGSAPAAGVTEKSAAKPLVSAPQPGTAEPKPESGVTGPTASAQGATTPAETKPASPDTAKEGTENPASDKGFFGRMIEKMGF